jgi:glutamyl-tRNA synthetase
VLNAAIAALEALERWTASEIEQALKGALVDGLGLKPRRAFQPIRLALTGSSVSPGLFESLELLGKTESLARIAESSGFGGASGSSAR